MDRAGLTELVGVDAAGPVDAGRLVQPIATRPERPEVVCRTPSVTWLPKAEASSAKSVVVVAAGSAAAPAGAPAATSVTPAVPTQARTAMTPRVSRGLCRGLSPGILVDELDMVPPQGRRHEGP